jgi:putative hemolysin
MKPNTPETDTFSYAAPGDPKLKRFVIRLIERMTGQPYLKWLYEDYRASRKSDESFWEAAVRRLELHIVCNEEALAKLPRQGALVVVANHPFGVLDGVVISHLISRVRGDFRVLTNSVLFRAEELRPYLFPIDFAETPEAMAVNLRSRAAAKQHLISGGCLIVFPAGGASTVRRPWHKRAVDAEWKKFAARLIVQARAAVVPVYFAGQNSRLFQVASHISMTLRLSLFFREVHNKIGSEIRLRIGDVIPFSIIEPMDRNHVMHYLRDVTYGLGGNVANPPRPAFRRPKRRPG